MTAEEIKTRIEKIDSIILNLELSEQDFVNAKYIKTLLSERRILIAQLWDLHNERHSS